MPELPEIETVRLQLSKVLVGRTIERVDIRKEKIFIGDKQKIEGKKVVDVRRRAKVLIIDLEGNVDVAFHFKMSGQLVYDGYKFQAPSTKDQINSEYQIESLKNRVVGGHPTRDFVSKLPGKHTRVIFHMDKGVLYFNDQRIFGWVKAATKEEIESMKFLKDLGPEPFDIRIDEFIKKLAKTKKAIKTAIMDQGIIAGVGNIYANDALWEARINPQLPSHRLQIDQVKLLLEKIIMVLNEGIKYGGATMADSKYVDLRGLGGSYQKYFRTYAQEGRPCKRCSNIIVKTVIGGRGTYWCPVCQKQ